MTKIKTRIANSPTVKSGNTPRTAVPRPESVSPATNPGAAAGTPTSNWLPPQPPGVLAGDPKTTTRTRMRKKETVAGNWPLPVVPLAVRIYFPAGIACPKGGLVLKKNLSSLYLNIYIQKTL